MEGLKTTSISNFLNDLPLYKKEKIDEAAIE
jgi:hypothetical protein